MIDTDKLVTFGILHCYGDNQLKAEALWGVLQYGGKDRHEFISANDKDIQPTLENFMKLVTLDLATLMKDITGEIPIDFEDKE